MNINEIAKLAGVSRATVSRFLNDGYVSEDKKEKIRKVIEETGYKPSAQAQMLRTKKTNLVGVIIPKINSESISRMVAGISVVLSKAGYQLLLANTDNDEKEEVKYLRILAENQVDGIILIGTVFTAAHKKVLKELTVPVVILGQSLTGYSCVFYDDYHAAYDLTSLLLEHGKHPAGIGVLERDEAAGKRRREGFLDAVKDRGAAVDRVPFAQGTFRMDSGYEQAKNLLTTNPEIDSIFCATDSIAIGAVTYLRENGKKIPEEIQVAGIGDSEIARVCVPRLTTVHYFYKTSGEEAAQMLVNMLTSGDQIRREVKMGYEIVPGKTTVIQEQTTGGN